MSTTGKQDDLRSAKTRKSWRPRFVVVIVILVGLLGFNWRFVVTAYRHHRAVAALSERDGSAAVSHLRLALEADSEQPETHYLTARAYRRTGEMDKVRDHLDRAWKLGFNTELIKREQWLAMAQSGQLREAELHLPELLLSAGENGWEVCEAFAAGYIMAQRFAEAQFLIDGWKQDFPQDAQPHFFEGRCREASGANSDAVACYRIALDLDPDRLDIEQRMARLLVDLHEYQEAGELLERLIVEVPEESGVLNGYAEYLLEQGESEKAQATVEGLLKIEPDNVAGRITLSRIQSYNGDYESSLTTLAKLVKERSYDVEIRYLYALALQGADRGEEARGEFEFVENGRKALNLVKRWIDLVKDNPRDVDTRCQIGITLLQYDSPEDGATWLRGALDYDPDHQQSISALIDYYESSGNAEAAEVFRSKLNPPVISQ